MENYEDVDDGWWWGAGAILGQDRYESHRKENVTGTGYDLGQSPTRRT